MAKLLRPLNSDDSWALLRRAEVGRIAVVMHGQPLIFPVHFVVDEDHLVFSTDEGVKLDCIRRTGSVAFEVDGVWADEEAAWSVVVTGDARPVLDPDRLEDLGARLFPHRDPEVLPYLVEIVPDDITGRVLELVPDRS